MTDPAKYDRQSTATAQLNKLAKDISVFSYNATEEQKEALLRLLHQGQILELLAAWQKTDRRSQPRKPCSLTVQFAVEEQVLTEVIKNASTGGMLMQTFAPLRPGQEIPMTIWPSNLKEPVEATVEIVWTGEEGVGVQFVTPISEEIEKVIESL